MAGSTSEPGAFSLRSLVLSVYLPTLLFALGQGAVIPIVAIAARDLGASLAVAGFVAALRGIGVLTFDVPAGWLVGRFGESKAMAVGTLLVAASLVGSVLAPSVAMFALFTFLMGCGWSVWLLGRLSYVTETVPLPVRGRALSTLGGINRVGNFAGPFLGIVAIALMNADGAYIVHLIMALAALVVLVVFARGDGAGNRDTEGHSNFLGVVGAHREVFLTAGAGVVCIQVLRAARQVVLPLWAVHIGLDASDVSLIFGISMGMEMLLFYPAGTIMDHLGRKWVALPCLGIMSAGLLAIPLAQSFPTLALAGLVVGLGNGLGSGIVMTLGADFSPTVGRAQFLGAWRFVGDLGTAGGPLVVAGITGIVGLGPASFFMGLIGLGGVALVATRMPETLVRPGRGPRGTTTPASHAER